MSQKFFRWFVSLMLGLAMIAVISGPQAAHAAGPWYVAPTGDDNNNCLSPGTACATINAAIGKAADGDTIYVASGTYTDTISYVVNVNRSITLSGGWNTTFTIQNGATVVDGQNVRGGIFISNVNATLDHFVIRNGYVNYGAGIYINLSSVTIDNSTIIENHAYGGFYGGAINIESSTVTINNSTVSSNTGNTLDGATQSGGIHLTSGSLTIQNTTIANNSGSYGGGLRVNSGTLTLRNSILSNNTASTSGPDCFGNIDTSDHNIISNTSGCTVTPGPGDQFDVNPLLSTYPVGALAYFALLSSSPAIDAGDACLATDQRGVARPQGLACDTGSYEYTTPGVAASIEVSAGSNQRAAPTAAFAEPLAVNVLDSQGSPVSDETVNFTAPASGSSGIFTDTNTAVTSAITDNSGRAVSSVFTANHQLGSYVVTATVEGVPGSAEFALTNVAWFVAPTGDDSNDCATIDTPCLTINAAIGKAFSGDTIEVAVGTYTGAGTHVVQINKAITLSGGWNLDFSAQTGTSIIDGESARGGITKGCFAASLDRFIITNGAFYGGLGNCGDLTITNSSIQNNTTSNSFGGGMDTSSGDVVLKSVTVSGNSASFGGGISILSGTLALNNVTISNNNAFSAGSGIYVYPFGDTNASAANSVLAGNANSDCTGTIVSLGHNLVGNVSDCTFTPGTGDQINVNPLLGAFLPSQGYHPLLPSSPAIDAGDDNTCQNVDQRGVARLGTCDIGAYEYVVPGPAVSLSAVSGSNQIGTLNHAFAEPLRVAALDSQGSPVGGVSIEFVAPASGPSGTFAGTNSNLTAVDTDAGGVATAPIFTANDQEGAYTVSASSSGLGSVSFDLEQVAGLENDDFANALEITSLPFNVEASTVMATFEAGEPTPSCWPGYPLKTAWFAYTASTDTPLTMTLGSGSISPVVVLYTGSALDSLTELNCGFGGMSFMAQAGVTYYFQLSDNVGNEGTIPFTLDFTAPPTAEIFYIPSDPHVFESVIIASNTSDAFGIASYAWELSDGTTSDSSSFEHQFAADGDYTANLTVTSVDGLTGSASQVIQVRTHDVGITKIAAPRSANSGQTRAITVSIRNTRYPETVTVDLYKSTPGGEVWIDSLTLEVPARLGNKTKLFTFNYIFTAQDAQVGRVSFRAIATINAARDAFPQDNTVISLPPTTVSR